MFGWLAQRLIRKGERRDPDFIVGGADNPYLLRWWIIPRNRFFNVYLHRFMRSDDDRAHHDHPWINASFLLRGSYIEHEILAGGIVKKSVRHAGDWRVRWSGKMAHRIEIHNGWCWTLFVTGPVYRDWGFHCPDAGWVPWQEFTAADDKGSVGPGCN